MNTTERKEILAKARQWWGTLSINEMKAFNAKYKAVVVNGFTPLPSWLIEIYQAEAI